MKRRLGWNWERYAPWLLCLVVLVIYLPGTSLLPLVDRDEPRFATAAREMAERGDWIKPTFNGADRFDKPALSYWLMRAGYVLLGETETGARLPAVLCLLALVLLVWHTGRRWFSPAAGFAAGLMLPTSLQFFIHGRLALADMPMILCVAVACIALVELLAPEAEAPATKSAPDLSTGLPSAGSAPVLPPVSAGWWWALWLSLGLGFLAKGPIMWAVPALALLLWRWVFWRQPLPWTRLGAGWGVALMLLIVAAWGIPALLVTEGRFFAVGIGEHVVQRGLDKFNGRSYNPLFYFLTAPVTLFPWIGFALLAWWQARLHWDARRAWLVSWLAAPYLIFTFYATQLPHYVLPGFPAFFLLLGVGVSPFALAAQPRWLRLTTASGYMLVAMVLVAAFALILTTPLPLPLSPLRPGLFGLCFVLGGFLLVATAWWRRRLLLVITGILLLGLGAHRMATSLREVSPSIRLQSVLAELPADTRCYGQGFAEPSLVFYSHRRWSLGNTPDTLAAALAQPGPVVVVALESECDPLGYFIRRIRWKDQPTAEPLKALRRFDSVEGFNLGRTRWQRLGVWYRP